MALTVTFEFLFFHFFGGHPWSELLAHYNVANGRVWVLILAWPGLAWPGWSSPRTCFSV
jgi:hypothetical protein